MRAEPRIAPERARTGGWFARIARAIWLAPFVAMLCLGGCTSWSEYIHNGFKVGPNYKKPAAPVAPEWIDAASPHVNTARPDLCVWWTVFDDPMLNHLVEVAYRQNLDVKTAGARIIEARALRNTAVGGLFPQMQDAFASYERVAASRTTAFNNFITTSAPGTVTTLPGFFDQWSAGFNLSWELDFWGRFRRAIEAADARFNASIENYDSALVLMIADVAAYYVQLRTYQERIKYAEDNIAIQEDLTRKAKERLAAGEASKLDLAQMRSNLTDTLALKATLEQGMRLANNQLCVVLGLPPHDLTKELGDGVVPATPPQVVAGVPADLLRRRPDVRSAEREVAAASAEIGVAVSDLYPHISIIGSLGWQSQNLTQLFESRSLNGNIGPSLQWNILNYGRIVNGIRAQDARFQQAAYTYQKTVLTAGREVEDGMIAFIKAHLRTLELTESAQNALDAVKIVQDQIKLQKFDINRAFVTSNFLVQQQDKLAQAKGDIALGLIQVYRALGGGWQIRLQNQQLPAAACAITPSAIPAGTTPAGEIEAMPTPQALPTASAPTLGKALPAMLGVPEAAHPAITGD